jgi:hypothetical protein
MLASGPLGFFGKPHPTKRPPLKAVSDSDDADISTLLVEKSLSVQVVELIEPSAVRTSCNDDGQARRDC